MAVTKQIRLHQICGGFLTLDSGEVVQVDDSKLKLLWETLDENPTIIFCQYVAEIERIVKVLSKKYRVASYRDPQKRDQVYLDFLDGKIDIIVSQINSGSMGLNLQRANRVIFYSWGYEYSSYDQAIERIERPGQKNAMEVIHLVVEDSIDEDILEVLNHKERRANKLLDRR
jgi:SNF2 family DNA or RNA helicase